MGYLALITTWVGTWFGFKYSGLDAISHGVRDLDYYVRMQLTCQLLESSFPLTSK